MTDPETGQLSVEWLIEFIPSPEFFTAGDDLIAVVEILSQLGELTVSVMPDRLPAFSDYDYEQCYLSWQFILLAQIDRSDIEIIFDALQGEFELNIAEVSSTTLSEDDQNEVVQQGLVTEPEISQNQIMDPAVISIDQHDSEAMTRLMIELNTAQSQLDQIGQQVQLSLLPKLTTGLEQLDDQIRELQAKWQSISTCSSSELFGRIEQVIADYCQLHQQTLKFEIRGSELQIDKLTAEKVLSTLNEWLTTSDIKSQEESEIASEVSVQCSARQHYDTTYIELAEHGLNLSPVTDMIFDTVTGNYKTDLTETGTLTTIVLPAVPALLDSQLVTLGDQDFIVPIANIVDTLVIQQSEVKELSDKAELYLYNDDYIPIIRLASLFHIRQENDELTSGWLIIVQAEQEKVGIVIDDIAIQQSVWVKYFEHHYRQVPGLAGAARIAEGRIALILDIATIIGLFKNPELGASTVQATVAAETDPGIQRSEPAMEQHQPYLTFLLAGDNYGIDLLRIEEVTTWSPLTIVPNTPSYMRGLLTWRGQLIPVIDLNQKWGGDAHTCTAMTTVIVVAVQHPRHRQLRAVGLIVDAIINTYDIDNKDIKAAPDFGQRVDTANLLGLVDIEQQLTMLLDVDMLLSVEQLA